MERDADAYLAMIDLYREQMESIETQSAYIQAIINDYTKAKVTIENLEKRGEGEILIPIGGGVFIPAKCEKVSEVLVSEGADIVIKKDLQSAKESIEKQIEILRENLKQLNETYQKIQKRINELTEKLREIMEKKGQDHVQIS